MDLNGYRELKLSSWREYEAGEITLQDYYEKMDITLKGMLFRAFETNSAISGICMMSQLLHSECVREQFKPYWTEVYEKWLNSGDVPEAILNMKFEEHGNS
jgi:hypothetical protein